MLSDPFAPPQRAGHARSYSAPGPSPLPAPQPHNSAVNATAQLLAGGGTPAAQQRDPFAPNSSLHSTSSGGTPTPTMNGAPGPLQPSAVDPFAPKPLLGLGVASSAARLAATPPAKVLNVSVV
jgi:hypothetical protein